MHYGANVLFDISVADTGTVWAIGTLSLPPDTAAIYSRTPFQGWSPVSISDLPLHTNYNCIYAIDSSTAWIGTSNGKIYFTSNSGFNWILKIDAGQNSYVNDIKFSRIDKNYGYIFCDPPAGVGTAFKIFKTNNGGESWMEFNPVFGGYYVGTYKATCVTDSNHIWYGLNCQNYGCGIPKLAYSSNGGINWTLETYSYTDNLVLSVSVRNDNLTGLSSLFDIASRICVTENGGSSWIMNFQGNKPIFRIHCIDSSQYCYYMDPDNFYKSMNNGLNWDLMPSPNYYEQVVAFDFIRKNNKIYLWAATINTNILRCVDTVQVIGVKNIEYNVPIHFSLSQNYPNPFNPKTTIKYDIAKNGLVKISVYDILGRLVTTPVNEIKTPGNYSVIFDGSNLASGIYIYKLETEGFTDVKKMVLIK